MTVLYAYTEPSLSFFLCIQLTIQICNKMKSIDNVNEIYESPQIEEISIEVEQGFAVSDFEYETL